MLKLETSLFPGDFLLARSSMSLARLRSLESVELMSAAIEHLVKVSCYLIFIHFISYNLLLRTTVGEAGDCTAVSVS